MRQSIYSCDEVVLFSSFALTDLSFITTWPFLWKVCTVTLVSCLPLYVIKYLKRKFSPPSYSKLSSWSKQIAQVSFVLLWVSYLEHFFFNTLNEDGPMGVKKLLKQQEDFKWLKERKKEQHKEKDWKMNLVAQDKSFSLTSVKRILYIEGLKHLTSFLLLTKGQKCLPLLWKFLKISFKCHFLTLMHKRPNFVYA